MRVELLLELPGLTRQEIIVIKACAPDAKSFESVAATLVEQYSGVHLREGRSLVVRVRPIRLTLPMPGTMRRKITFKKIRTRRRYLQESMNLEIWSWKEVIRSFIWVSIGMKHTLRLPRR